LSQLEDKEHKVVLDLFNYDDYEDKNIQVVSPESVLLLEEIEKMDIDHLTPIDALLLLKHYQSLLKKK
jgi:DNA mismatch repair protein MutS